MQQKYPLALLTVLVAVLCGAAQAPALAQGSCAPPLRQLLETFRRKYDVPALAAVIVTRNGQWAADAVGRRDYNNSVAVTVNDQFHLGSCTKSMTASLLAILVDEGRLSWGDTLARIYPELAATMQPAYRDVNLLQLLAHRAGFGGVEATYPPGVDWWHLDTSPSQQRLRYVQEALKQAPAYPPGTQSVYTNVGYIVAGAIAERVAGQDWETLIRTRLFEPLGMSTAGFGPMGTPGRLDQPLQHVVQNGQHRAIPADPVSDNAPVIGPAGRVHCSLPDWGKYLTWHLQGARGQGRLLSADGFQRLQNPAYGDYGFGWIFADSEWGAGRMFWHNGSNTMNYSVCWIAPRQEFALAVATNQGNGGADVACFETGTALIQYYLMSR